MDTSRGTPEEPSGTPGKRRPPTIELTATEIAGETGDASSGQATSDSPRAASTASPWLLAAAGAAGVALAVIVLAVVGVFSPGREPGPPVPESRLARIEQQVRELAARPLPPPTDRKAIDDLAGRMAGLETAVATPKPPATDAALAERLAALEGELRALTEKVGGLGRRADEIAATAVQRADLDALSKRVAALEQAAKRLDADLAQRTGSSGTDRALRLMVLAQALRSAVERGVPFAAELDAVKAAAADVTALAPLEPFAGTGLPGADGLARDLLALLPDLSKAIGGPPRDAGFLDRLKANAEKIVRIRPIDDVPGDDPAAVLQRIEVRATQQNISGAIAELAKLPAPARAVAKSWIARAEARNAALAASRRFAADALAAAGRPSL